MPALIVDPALQAEVIRQFNLRGELSPFNLTENVVPIFDIGKLLSTVTPTVVTTLAGSQGIRVGTNSAINALAVRNTGFNDAMIVNSGRVTNPTAGTVLADTGQLVANGQVIHWIICSDSATLTLFDIQWRNAANSATIATWSYLVGGNLPCVQMFNQLNLNIVNNERVRIVAVAAVTGDVNATIGSTLSNASPADI